MIEFFEFLSSKGITPNGYQVLWCMHENIPNYPNVNLLTEKYKLAAAGILKEKIDSEKKISYEITAQGLLILEQALSLFSNQKAQKKLKKASFTDWESNIKAYNELFPKGKKIGSTSSFRTSPKELYERFKWFFAEYPEYDWELVLKATEQYVKHFEESCDYTYMQFSKYFIKKEDKNRVVTSNLATLCYNILEGNDVDMNSGYYIFN